MKKQLIAALAASAAAIATPALAAANDTGTVTINGTVAGRCLFTTNSATITVTELSDTGTGANAGKLNPASLVNQTRTLIGWCNKTASTMTVTAKPLTGSTTAPNTTFDDRVDIAASATANSQTAIDGSAGEAGPVYTAGAPATVGIFSGNVDVKITGATSPNNGILTAGTYTGSVDVTLAPAV